MDGTRSRTSGKVWVLLWIGLVWIGTAGTVLAADVEGSENSHLPGGMDSQYQEFSVSQPEQGTEERQWEETMDGYLDELDFSEIDKSAS